MYHFHLPSRLARRDVNMTQGNITRLIINFALPLMVGNLFQQLYNMVDTWVVGNFVSNEAFSAVGTVGPIVNTLIGFFTGLASGAGVVISQYYGAGREDKVRETVHTSIVMTLVLCVVFTGVGVGLTPAMLRIMKTPAEVMPESTAYLTVYFAGVSGLLLYNMGAGILRAVGDSQRPFYYLVVSALVNTGLDLLFVHQVPDGRQGCRVGNDHRAGHLRRARAAHTLREQSSIRLIPRELHMHWPMLGKDHPCRHPRRAAARRHGIFQHLRPVLYQLLRRGLHVRWTAYNKIDQLMFLPMQSVALAATTFVGQNLGIGNVERAKKGVRSALLISMATTAILMVPVLLFAPDLTAFFNAKPEVIRYGTLLLRWLSPFYILCCVNQVYAGALRGAGNSQVPMILMLSSFVVFRQCYLYVMSHFICNEVLPIALSYPAGWIVCSVATLLYYRRAKLDKTTLVNDL